MSLYDLNLDKESVGYILQGYDMQYVNENEV